ncbi:MAG: hypothetical protein L0K84_05775, partial [Acidipropionibacterium jensenii]|nr:hypothetical protein [Acidipropionibacterium jensenii]
MSHRSPLTTPLSRRHILSTALGGTALLALSACGATDSSSGSSASPSGSPASGTAPTDSFPVSITHAWGSTT